MKLIIPGEYWDSQLYEGRLYLFECDGSIRSLNWDRVIDEWQIEKQLKLAITCAFSRSDYLYGSKWDLLFADVQIREILTKKFDALTGTDLQLSRRQLENYTTGVQENPFPFPHSDCTIYRRQAYVACSTGVYSATCNRRTKYPVSLRVQKRWDAPVLAISASYNQLALAAGGEGLFELHVADVRTKKIPPVRPPLSTSHCTDCEWAFYSIYASSHRDRGYLAAFVKDGGLQNPKRHFDRLIPDEGIFMGRGYSWGNQDKLCQAREGAIRIVKYEPWRSDLDLRFRDLGSIQLSRQTGEVIAGSVALFGIIIECDNAVLVVPSEGEPITLTGEPVNWRAFPRSKHYENQLHVIYDDRLEIYSFNHDYFVDQEAKRSGVTYRGDWQPYSRTQARFWFDEGSD